MLGGWQTEPSPGWPDPVAWPELLKVGQTVAWPKRKRTCEETKRHGPKIYIYIYIYIQREREIFRESYEPEANNYTITRLHYYTTTLLQHC